LEIALDYEEPSDGDEGSTDEDEEPSDEDEGSTDEDEGSPDGTQQHNSSSSKEALRSSNSSCSRGLM
jgi:hypothetical protein